MGNASRQKRAEAEILQAASRFFQQPAAASADMKNCPNAATLRRFVAGEENSAEIRNAVLAHLAVCDTCLQFMAKLRKRAVVTRYALAAAVALAAILSVWMIRQRPIENSNSVAVVDLRLVASTRGNDFPAKDFSLKVRRNVQQLQIVLPVGSAAEGYELALYEGNRRDHLIFERSVEAHQENHDTAIRVPIDSLILSPGRYWLALRHPQAAWEFYPLAVE